MLDGYATINYPNGDVYEGDVRYGDPDGVGTMKLAEGGKYVGEFKSGFFYGRGTKYDATDKVTLQGFWRNGSFVDK